MHTRCFNWHQINSLDVYCLSSFFLHVLLTTCKNLNRYHPYIPSYHDEYIRNCLSSIHSFATYFHHNIFTTIFYRSAASHAEVPTSRPHHRHHPDHHHHTTPSAPANQTIKGDSSDNNRPKLSLVGRVFDGISIIPLRGRLSAGSGELSPAPLDHSVSTAVKPAWVTAEIELARMDIRQVWQTPHVHHNTK